MGRPKAEVDANEVYELALIQCTYEEISAVLGVSKDTLHRRFRTEIDKGHEAGKKSLRRAQFDNAIKQNNTVMQIWLGKQYLGQRDKSDLDIQSGLTVVMGKEFDDV